jgi:hypothetical protein
MKLEYVNKIIKAIYKIAKKGKIVNNSMPNTTGQTATANLQQPVVKITPNTPIVFTLKGFLSTIVTILGLFIGFYKLAIQPAMKQSETHYKEMQDQQKSFITEEFDDVKDLIKANTNAIGLNTKAIKANNDRFKDLNESVEDIANSGGSFGSVVSVSTPSADSALVDHH